MTAALVERRNVAMLTALADNGDVLNLATMTVDAITTIHGKHNRRRAGIRPTCRGCGAGVHVVRSPRGLWYFQHNPGRPESCAQVDLGGHGESVEHFTAKAAVAGTLHRLTGWEVDCEHVAHGPAGDVRVDVEAKRTEPGRHAQQTSTAFEIQLSKQTYGEFVARSERINSAVGHRACWITPHDHLLGDVFGIVTDTTATNVTGRLYGSVDQTVELAPVELGAAIVAVFGGTPTLELSQSGDIDSISSTARAPWIMWPRSSRRQAPRPKPAPVAVSAGNRSCDRPEPEPLDTTITAIRPDPPLFDVSASVDRHPTSSTRTPARRTAVNRIDWNALHIMVHRDVSVGHDNCTHCLTSLWPHLDSVPVEWRGRTRCAFCGWLDPTVEQ